MAIPTHLKNISQDESRCHILKLMATTCSDHPGCQHDCPWSKTPSTPHGPQGSLLKLFTIMNRPYNITCCKGGLLPVIRRVTTPLVGGIQPQLSIYFRPFRGIITPLMPTLWVMSPDGNRHKFGSDRCVLSEGDLFDRSVRFLQFINLTRLGLDS